MDTLRSARRLGTLCLVGLLVIITAVPPRAGYTARLDTEEAPTTRKPGQRRTAQDGRSGWERRGRAYYLL